MSLDPFVPSQLPFLQKGEALLDVFSVHPARVGIAGLSLRLFLYSGWLLERKSKEHHTHQHLPRVPKAPQLPQAGLSLPCSRLVPALLC